MSPRCGPASWPSRYATPQPRAGWRLPASARADCTLHDAQGGRVRAAGLLDLLLLAIWEEKRWGLRLERHPTAFIASWPPQQQLINCHSKVRPICFCFLRAALDIYFSYFIEQQQLLHFAGRSRIYTLASPFSFLFSLLARRRYFPVSSRRMFSRFGVSVLCLLSMC